MHRNSLDAFAGIRPEIPTRRKAVYDIIRQRQAITEKEVADALGWDRNSVSPRITELKRLGFVIEGGSILQNGRRAALLSPVDTKASMIDIAFRKIEKEAIS